MGLFCLLWLQTPSYPEHIAGPDSWKQLLATYALLLLQMYTLYGSALGVTLYKLWWWLFEGESAVYCFIRFFFCGKVHSEWWENVKWFSVISHSTSVLFPYRSLIMDLKSWGIGLKLLCAYCITCIGKASQLQVCVCVWRIERENCTRNGSCDQYSVYTPS